MQQLTNAETIELVVDWGEDEQDDNDEPEIATDGGEDITECVDDDTIKAAIDKHDDPDHPDATTVEEVRVLLDYLFAGSIEAWDQWMGQIEDGDFEVVGETADMVIISTGEIKSWDAELDRYEGEVDEIARSVLSSVIHTVAKRETDRNWRYSYPMLLRKPESFDAGRRYVDTVVNSLQKRGCSPGQAWAYYGVELRGESRNRWGSRKGDSDHKNVSNALDEAKRKLP